MTEQRVSLRERPHAETCPFCHDSILAEQETWPCEKCGTRLHAECFDDNRLACTVLGCGGRAVTPEGYGRSDRANDPRFSPEARRERQRAREERRRIEDLYQTRDRVLAHNAREGPGEPAKPWFRGRLRVAVIVCMPFAAGASGWLGDPRGSTSLFLFSLFFCVAAIWLSIVAGGEAD